MKFKYISALSFLIFINLKAYSAPPPPPGGSPLCWPPPCVPIDGGISILMAAGALLGGKKLYDISKEKNKL